MWLPMYWPTKICWCWVDIIFLEMLWLWAVFANEYMFLYPLQSMQLFANCCWYCKLHISGSNLHLRGRLYSHVFIYLDFEVYKYFITIYCYVSRYKQNDLLVIVRGTPLYSLLSLHFPFILFSLYPVHSLFLVFSLASLLAWSLILRLSTFPI